MIIFNAAHHPGRRHMNIPAARMRHISPHWWSEGRREPCCSLCCDQWEPSRLGKWRWTEQTFSSTRQKWHQWKRGAPARYNNTTVISLTPPCRFRVNCEIKFLPQRWGRWLQSETKRWFHSAASGQGCEGCWQIHPARRLACRNPPEHSCYFKRHNVMGQKFSKSP